MAKINANYDRLTAGYLFPEVARRAQAFVQAHPGVKLLRLGIGDTTEPLAPAVIQGLRERVERLAKVEMYTGYGDYEGELALREAICRAYAERGIRLGTDEIFVSDGAKSDSGNIQSLFSSESVVAVEDPAYPVYVDSNVIAGRCGSFDSARQGYRGLVYMPCTEQNGFFPVLPAARVDLAYLCSPNNPTGAVATRANIRRFVDWALEHRAVIIFDAAYASYIRDPELPRSVYEVPGSERCAIEINSFAKSAGFTGVRLGWSVVPNALAVEDGEPGKLNQMWRRRQSTFFNGASNIAQQGGIAALSEQGHAECQRIIDYYMDNAAIIRSALLGLGLTCYGGSNAPYVWLKTPAGMKSWDFFDKLLAETHVVTTPGSGFGPSGEGFVRLSAFGHRADIEEAAESIRTNLRLG
ncbi:MAG: LL-diaminopimelate aminotransferase [Polyangiaceae bacterium]|nr:LL-diaminopimelate aminotransferase [Polyangiaceae bacterium]